MAFRLFGILYRVSGALPARSYSGLLSIVVANSLILTGGIFLWTGIRSFFGLRCHWWLPALFVLSATVLLSLFMVVRPSLSARQTIMSVFPILISLFAIHDVLQQRSSALIMETNLFIGFVGAEAVIHFIRIITLMKTPASTGSYLPAQDQPDKLFFILLFMSGTSIGISLYPQHGNNPELLIG